MPKSLILIPALLCDEAMYTGVIGGLGDSVAAQVVMSPQPTMAASVADILARAPEKFALAGTSYGGSLALEVALAAPERVTALWLMGCDGDQPDRERFLGMAQAVESNFDATLEALAGDVVKPAAVAARETVIAMAHRVGAAAGAAQLRALAGRPAVWDRIGALRMPCLVVWGVDDALVPVAVGRKLAEALPHAHFFAVPDCGHLPTLEKSAAVTALVEDFLADEHSHHH